MITGQDCEMILNSGCCVGIKRESEEISGEGSDSVLGKKIRVSERNLVGNDQVRGLGKLGFDCGFGGKIGVSEKGFGEIGSLGDVGSDHVGELGKLGFDSVFGEKIRVSEKGFGATGSVEEGIVDNDHVRELDKPGPDSVFGKEIRVSEKGLGEIASVEEVVGEKGIVDNDELFEELGYKIEGFEELGYEIKGLGELGYNIEGLEELGFNIEAFEELGFNIEAFEELGTKIEENNVFELNDHVRELDKMGSGSGCVFGKEIRVSEKDFCKIESVNEVKEMGILDNGHVGEFGGLIQNDHVRELDTLEDVNWFLDLNEPVLGSYHGGNEMGSQINNHVEPIYTDRELEIITISSDETEGECEELVDWGDNRGKEKEKETHGCTPGFDLDFGMSELELVVGESSLMNGERRFTREEKGKTKVVESWLSLDTNENQLEMRPEMQVLIESAVSGLVHVPKSTQPVENNQLHVPEEREIRQEPVENARPQESPEARAIRLARERDQEREYRERKIRHRREQAREFAIFHQKEDSNQKPIDQEPDMDSGPFSTALKIIRERNSKESDQQLIKWEPVESYDHSVSIPLVPSLLDLSLKVLAKNAEAIVSLEPCPDGLRQRLADLLCDSRQMNIDTLDLFVRGSPSDIRIKDCSWMTEEQFMQKFGSFDTKNLTVLQLDLCGQCVIDDTLSKTLAQPSKTLPGLRIISLRGGCRLSDNALKTLVSSAPSLCSINLGQCSLLTNAGINILADSLGPILRELYIDDCSRIDAMLIAPSLKKFKHLEVLSIAGIPSVCDEFVNDIITARGQNIKELDLADCPKLTDISLKVIGICCSELRSFNISNLDKLTDLGLGYLSNGCRTFRTLKLCRNRFSDEAMAAFLEVSGQSLQELSVNNVVKVGPSTALSLAKCSRKLLCLDVSWCRKLTDEALGLIVDSCSSLKLLKLFGCTQITNVFLNGHSNPLVQILGLNMTRILQHVNMLEAKEVLLRYSPLPHSFDSQNVYH